MNEIKKNRVYRMLATCGKVHNGSETLKAITDGISEEMWSTMTSTQIYAAAIALDRHWHKAQAVKEQEIIDEGFVWSNKHNKLLELQF